MAELTVTLTPKQCDLIALALDALLNSVGAKQEEAEMLNELFLRFDTLSEESIMSAPKPTGIHLVWDKESNIRPLFPKG